MRRNVVRLVLAAALLLVLTVVSRAQDDPPQPPPGPLLIMPELPQLMIDGAIALPQAAERKDTVQVPLELLAEEPSDSCVDAPPLVLTRRLPAEGSSANVSNATSIPQDPVLRCMWGDPPRTRGYRTVWYRLVAPENGVITLSTFGSNYDTVLAVHQGECSEERITLTPLLCNDDASGFTSEITLTVSEGDVYFIEVADWQPGLPEPAQLRFSALLQPIEPEWEQVNTDPLPPAVSRHATVVKDYHIYVIGGQKVEDDTAILSNEVWRFNTISETWEQMASIPGAGYANTTAAIVNGRVYLPSGYSGSEFGYDGLHWVYDPPADPQDPTDGGRWSTVAYIPEADLPGGKPLGYAATAVPPTQNRYFLTGGMTSTVPAVASAEVSAETYAYLPDVNAWQKLVPMQAGRYAHTSAWIGGLGVCVAGGLGVQRDEATGQDLAILHPSVECFTPGGSWRYVANMQIPRFGAGSAVGPDGKWYVFGGRTILFDRLVSVPQTEVYDPRRNTWTVLPPEYNLGSTLGIPPRYWPREGMVYNTLWVIGGSIFNNGEQAVPVVERLYIPSDQLYVPAAMSIFDNALSPDENLAQARAIALGTSQAGNFNRQLDFYDFYTFDLPADRRVTIRLEVPDNNNFDLALYGQNKLLWGESNDPFNGENERIEVVLPARRYFILVSRLFPTGTPDRDAYYTLTVE